MPEWGSDADAEPDLDVATEAQAPGPDLPVETGDIVIDAALRDLDAVDVADLDGHVEAAEALQRTLQGRLANLGE
ncbi:MAG: hypothetical protein GX344_01615 [Intrasporangiaceae bacterium]|nr:hypothetical protein [Intrasporangiaceae bacterium]